MNLQMQVDRMFSKKNGEGYIYTRKGWFCTSYNGAKTGTRKHSFKSSAINGRAKGGKKKRNCGHAYFYM